MTTLLAPTTHDAPAPRDFLLATWDGGGHAGPMLSVARGLVARGHRVRVMADPILRPDVEASGAGFVPYSRAPHRKAHETRLDKVSHDWESKSPAAAAQGIRDALICGPAGDFAADVREELARRGADVVAADHMLPGVLIGAEAEGVATASIATTFLFVPEWGVPPMGLGMVPSRNPVARLRAAVVARMVDRMWRGGLPAFNAARVDHGLAPVSSPLEVMAGPDRVLVLASEALDFPEFSPPPHVRLVGARIDDSGWEAPWSPPEGEAPLVLVSLSSSFMDQGDVLRRIATALGELDVRGLLTTGHGIDPAAIPAPANVSVVSSAPHTEVLRHAAATVTHAGHGTASKALAHGVPVLAMPLGRDQRDVAARISARGAGRTLKASASPARIARELRALLGEPGYALAAARVAAEMAEERRSDRAVAELEELAGCMLYA